MKYKLICILVILTAAAGCRRVTEWSLHEQIIPVYKGQVVPQSPGIVRLSGGTWMLVYAAGPDSAGVMMTRADGLQGPWSQPVFIAKTTSVCTDPKIVQMKSGLILVHFNIGPNAENESRQSAGAATVVSYDYGERFSVPKPIRIPGTFRYQISGTLIELSEDYWLLPVLTGSELTEPALIVSKDAGESWSEVRPVTAFGSCSDWSLLRLEPSFLAAICSPLHDDLCMRTRSSGPDSAWEPPVPVNIYGVRPEWIQSTAGTVYAVYEDLTPPGLSMMASYDFGKSFENESVLSVDGYSARPSCCFDNPERLVLVYTAGDGIRLTVKQLGLTGVPGGLSVTSDSGVVLLRWNRVPEAAYYRIYRSEGIEENAKTDPVLIRSQIETVFRDPEVATGLTYTYQVSAVMGTGRLISGTGSEGKPSRPVSGKIP